MKKDVLILLPVYNNQMDVGIHDEIHRAINDPNCCVGGLQYYNGDSLIPRGRNKLAKMLLDSPYQYGMFIDSDIEFNRAQINQLRKHGKALIGGTYLKKTLPYQPVLNGYLGEEGELKVYREIGTGFMMFNRCVLGAIRERFPERKYKPESDEPNGENYFDWFGVGVYEGRYLSEDYYFCRLAAECEYKSYIDPTVMVGHKGQATYPMDDVRLLETAHQLVDKWNPNVEMPKEKIDAISEAIQKQSTERGWDKKPENRSVSINDLDPVIINAK